MIVGTGIDIAEVPRIGDAIDQFGERFLLRIFTEEERGIARERLTDMGYTAPWGNE